MVQVNIPSIDRLTDDDVNAPDAGTPDIGDLSGNGRYVVYSSGLYDEQVFLVDTKTGAKTIVSISNGGVQGDEDSFGADISANGRYVVYASDAENLVPGDFNDATDIFRYDVRTGETERISVASGGEEANGDSFQPDISADGRYVVYTSEATNLSSGERPGSIFDIFLYDAKTGRTTMVSEAVSKNASTTGATISGDGRFVIFDAAVQAGPSAHGVYLYDVKHSTTQLISTPPGVQFQGVNSFANDITSDGRYVLFTSDQSNLVAGDTNRAGDVFRYDTQTGVIVRVSLGNGGRQGDEGSSGGTISANGRYVVFSSNAENLVAGDDNDAKDVFLHDVKTGQTIRISLDEGGDPIDNRDFTAVFGQISEDGRSFIIDTLSDIYHGQLDGVADLVGRTIEGNGRDNNLTGTALADTILGAGGDDTLRGGGGADRLDGGAGLDTVRYVDSATGVTVSLKSGRGDGGTATGDRYFGIENVEGSKFADALTGNGFANVLRGLQGADTLNGLGGADTLEGGAGKDTFVFSSPIGRGNVDTLADFSVRDDTIHLDNAVMKALGGAGRLDRDLFWASETGRAHDADDRIVYETDTGRLFYDANGNAAGGSVLLATLSPDLKLTNADFVVI